MVDTIWVSAIAGDRRRGLLAFHGTWAPCALGRSGIRLDKREGDGATPAGRYELLGVLWRPDRVARPVTGLPVAKIRPDSGWCDDPADRRYNRPVRLPYRASHERLWRDDRLYDLVVVIDHNFAHPVPGRGSAVFLHLAAPGFGPTAGCVAMTETTMRRLLARARPGTTITIG
ncbi:MAG TPA: L,D-transpeptidase family protein [Bauldia sp.]|nr:L,D-transpeptidase family protein [Bauldia sp.]